VRRELSAKIFLLALVFVASGLHSPIASADLKKITGSVFVIVMENTDWSDIKGSRHAPYINSLLSHRQASYANKYYNPPYLHPSEPNYIWMEAGTNFDIRNDQDATFAPNQIRNQDHLVKQLAAQHISWKSYQEDISGKECPLTSTYPYAAKHNPFIFFDDVTEGFRKDSRYCIDHIRPFTELSGDLSRNSVARYIFITPNICNDMHDACAPLNDNIRQGDDWLRDVVPKILQSNAYKANGALIITWDEGGHGDGPIGFIVLSPRAKGKGYANSICYTHGSLLRTLEEIFGAPLLNDAARQIDLADLFQ
jgi:hypothetical protein